MSKKLNKYDIIKELISARKNVGNETFFICNHIYDLEVKWWFTKQRDLVPERFRGVYWEGNLSWWNVMLATRYRQLPELMKLKREYLTWLIEKVKSDRVDL